MVSFDYDQPAQVLFDSGDGVNAIRSLSGVSLADAIRTVMEEFTPRQMRAAVIRGSTRTLRHDDIAEIYSRSDFPKP